MIDLEPSIRATYRPPAAADGSSPRLATFHEESVRETVAKAAANGAVELHLFAWSFAPGVPIWLRGLGAELGVTVRPIRIPRELILPTMRRLPVFVEAAELEAALVRHPDGSLDIQLVHFHPGLPISPKPTEPKVRARAARSGFDFADYWAVDFQCDPQAPFAHHWRWGRGHRRRKVVLQSAARRPVEDAGPQIGVKLMDVFGYETLALLSTVE